MDRGQYGEYIHGIPTGERPFLGRPASHGCMRMSNENVLQIYQRYADVGSTVKLLRDRVQSGALAATFKSAGGIDHTITDGAELVGGAVQGTLPTPVQMP